MNIKIKKLIINADDFGYTPGVTQGIIEAYKKGIITSTTALSVSKHFLPSMETVLINAPSLPIGVHLTLTLQGGKPILPIDLVPSLVDENGNFWNQNIFEEKVNLEEVYIEWEAQILRFIESGKRPDHMDSHHNVHGKNEELLKVALSLAKKYNLPLRNASRSPSTEYYIECYDTIQTTDKILPNFYGENATYITLKKILDEIVISDKEIFEMNVHPAFVDALLLESSSYALERVNEFKILTSKEVKKLIKQKGILLTNYGIFG